MSKRKRRPKADKSFTVIPEYRDQIDAHKLCQVIILASKDMAKKGSAECSDTADK